MNFDLDLWELIVRFVTDREYLCWISWKLDLYFLRERASVMNQQANERTNQYAQSQFTVPLGRGGDSFRLLFLRLHLWQGGVMVV